MKAFVGITDKAWFDLLASQPGLDEVNFWQPGGRLQFRALQPGEMFLFKLHSPLNFIVGGGFFAHSSLLPVSLAWESFGIANGVQDFATLRRRLDSYRSDRAEPGADYQIGCILLEQPFFLPREKWIPVPSDWSSSIQTGKLYDLTVEPGRTLWNQVQAAMAIPVEIPQWVRETAAPYGTQVMVTPRLGQGSFRVMVTDAYQRKCAITRERTLPALEAAHIKPYAESNDHQVSNGLLLRRDLHALFDKGYVTVTPEYKVEVSSRIKAEFENGHEYYAHHGAQILLPANAAEKPSQDYLRWHNETAYKG